MTTKKQALQREILRRSGLKNIDDWVKTACMGKTVKEAHEVMTSDKFLEIFVKNTLPVAPAGKDYTDETLSSLLDLLFFFVFQSVFRNAHTYFWNCRHHGLNCEYILTEKDLTED